MENIDETFKAECINDKWENNSLYKLFGITKGKTYQVKESTVYSGYYELVNNLGQVDTYRKERFKIIDKPVMEVGEMKFYENGDVKYPISKEEYEKAIEGDKMEDKTIKVRCINNNAAKDLLYIDKIYISYRENEKCYEIIDEKGNKGFWGKTRFEKVEEVLMVECIENKKYKYDNITIGKEYRVLDKTELTYKITTDDKEEAYYYKDCFKPVEPQKEIKEYSAIEILEFEEGTKFKNIKSGNVVEVVTVGENKYIKGLLSGANLLITSNLLKRRYIKVEEPKPVTTATAFKALQEGKIIESEITKDQYKKGVKLHIKLYTEQEKGFVKCKNISSIELEGLWIIHE